MLIVCPSINETRTHKYTSPLLTSWVTWPHHDIRFETNKNNCYQFSHFMYFGKTAVSIHLFVKYSLGSCLMRFNLPFRLRNVAKIEFLPPKFRKLTRLGLNVTQLLDLFIFLYFVCRLSKWHLTLVRSYSMQWMRSVTISASVDRKVNRERRCNARAQEVNSVWVDSKRWIWTFPTVNGC